MSESQRQTEVCECTTAIQKCMKTRTTTTLFKMLFSQNNHSYLRLVQQHSPCFLTSIISTRRLWLQNHWGSDWNVYFSYYLGLDFVPGRKWFYINKGKITCWLFSTLHFHSGWALPSLVARASGERRHWNTPKAITLIYGQQPVAPQALSWLLKESSGANFMQLHLRSCGSFLSKHWKKWSNNMKQRNVTWSYDHWWS